MKSVLMWVVGIASIILAAVGTAVSLYYLALWRGIDLG